MDIPEFEINNNILEDFELDMNKIEEKDDGINYM